MYKTREEVMEKMREIQADMENIAKQVEAARQRLLMDRGRLQELAEIHNSLPEPEEKKKPAPKKKAPAKKPVRRKK